MQWKILAALLLLLLGSLMALAPFTIEDAYITFRYSRNVAAGLGPVYNPGEYVEGYTAPVWMALMVIPHALGLNIELFSGVLGILFSIGTALIWLRMLGGQFAGRWMPLVLAITISTQSTLIAFSYSGMETAQNLFLISLLLHRMARIPLGDFRARDWLLSGGLLFLCQLSRPDNAVVLMVAGLVAAWGWMAGEFPAWKRKTGAMLLVFLPLCALYLLWKYNFYGDLLPNTFYAKGGGHLRQGMQYLALFTLSSALPIAWLLGAIGLLLRKSATDPLRRFCLLFPAIWMAYLVSMGGDFMEFRMMAPAIPCMVFVAAKGLSEWRRKPGTAMAAAGLLIAANIFLSLAFNFIYPTGFVMSAVRLADETGHPGCGNVVQGRKLHALFGQEKDLRLASGGAGAMPYYAQSYLLDMVGLTDFEVGRHGMQTGGIPGHRRFARLETLMRRDIHLVIGTWHLQNDSTQSCSSDAPELLGMLGISSSLPDGIRLVSMPLLDGWEQRMAYLHPHPALELALAAGLLREIKILR